MTSLRPRRSALYMPGANARAIAKSRTLPADCVILDLEDSVAPDAKAAARDQVVEAVRAGGFGGREVVIRVNGPSTPWGADDLVAAAAAAPDAILLPKVSEPDAIAAAERALATHRTSESTRLWAMVETPLAILNIAAIAAAGGRLACLVVGTNDLLKETRARSVAGRWTLLPWLAAILAAARAHGIDVLDGVYNDLADLDGLQAECEQGRDLGFDGKTLIHPNQIEPANTAFSPAAADVAAARAIMAAFERPENRDLGVISLDGRMVERLHAEMAARTVALADAIAALATAPGR